MSASVNLKLLKSWLVLDVMNCPQLTSDRPDLPYTTSVLMRTLETPPELEQMQLMRPESYVNASSELVCVFRCQEQPL